MIVSTMNFYLGKEQGRGSKEREGEIRRSPTPAVTFKAIEYVRYLLSGSKYDTFVSSTA